MGFIQQNVELLLKVWGQNSGRIKARKRRGEFGSNVGDVSRVEARERAAQESRCEAVRAEPHLLTESRNTMKKEGRPAGEGNMEGRSQR